MASIAENERRIARLAALIQARFEGNETACGRALGFKDGAYVRQMLAGKRPITEKSLAKWRGLSSVGKWFDEAVVNTPAPPATNFQDPVGDTGFDVMRDLDALHPDDRAEWIKGLHAQAEKAREIGRRAIRSVMPAKGKV